MRRALVTSPSLSSVTSYLPSTSVVLGMRSSSTTSRVTVHSLPFFSIPVTASTGRPISSCTCCIAPITTSRGERLAFERELLLPEELCLDFEDPPLELDDPPLELLLLRLPDFLVLRLPEPLLRRRLDSAIVKPFLALH